jgi:hypothetical protein
MHGERPPRASRLETLGAWLGVWTPPRDVEVPPVPWGAVGVGAALLAVVAGAFLALGAPAIDTRKDEAARERERALETARAERVAAQRVEQRPRTGRGSADPRGAGRVERLRARRALAEAGRAAVTRDARARTASGELERAVRDTVCVRFPRNPRAVAPADALGLRRGAYDCLARTAAIDGGRGTLGYPYRLLVDFAAGRFALCRIAPPPSEKAAPDPRRAVELPAACRTSG